MAESPDRRIRGLLEAASAATAGGRAQEAERMLTQARLEAPEHPLVLNESARQLLLAGQPAGAHALLERALLQDASQPTLWLNLAAALRGLARPDDEMSALDKVLELEPRHTRALLQKASLQEMQGNVRAAAATYRNALQRIPPGLELPTPIRAAMQHASEVIAANDRALELFLEDRLGDLRQRYAGQSLERFDRCLATLLRKQPVYRPQPTFMYFPHLPAIEFYEREDFPWLDSLEAATDDIRAELIDVLSDGPAALQPYVGLAAGVPLEQWRELNHSRRWGVYNLWREGVAFPEHLARCPRTAAALEHWPRCDIRGCGPTALFSILDAKTRIPAHCGVNNTRLIVHLPLIVPPDCLFRVGAERREWCPGQALVFDDTFEHEAWNDSDLPRAVLILDIWSPFVSPAERELVRQVTADIGEYYGTPAYQGA